MLPSELVRTTIAQDDLCVVRTDLSHFPLIINQIKGKATLGTTTDYWKHHEAVARHAANTQQRIIIINDFSEAGTPDAVVRKAFAQGAEDLAKISGSPLICFVPIFTSALFRGVMTAVTWMIQDNSQVPIHFAKSLSDAINIALRQFEQQDLSWPEIEPKTYVFPES